MKMSNDLEVILSKKNYYLKVDAFDAHLAKHMGDVLYSFFDLKGDFIITFFVIQDRNTNILSLVSCSESLINESPSDLDLCISFDPKLDYFLDSKWIKEGDSKKLYPLRLISEIVSFNLHNKEIGCGHTITTPSNSIYQKDNPFPQFKSFMIDVPMLFSERFGVIEEYPSLILSVYPLLEKEYQYKKKFGSEKLGDLLYNANALVFDPDRCCVVDK